MGLFSKKVVVCKLCGAEFETRFPSMNEYCKECEEKKFAEWSKKAEEENALKESIKGYIEYGKKYLKKTYSLEEMKEIEKISKNSFEKYRKEVTVTKERLQIVREQCKKLSDEECLNLWNDISSSILSSTMGATYSSKFFVLSDYSKVLIPAEDVFAAGYTTSYKLDVGKNEAILCIVFTNNPYVPVFPMVFIGETSFFELVKSKKGRESVTSMFSAMCPNLKYSVTDVKELKKEIKKDNDDRGNLDKNFMLECISDVLNDMGIFKVKNMSSRIDGETEKLLESYGYITEHMLDVYLGLAEKKYAKFWGKKLKKIMGK